MRAARPGGRAAWGGLAALPPNRSQSKFWLGNWASVPGGRVPGSRASVLRTRDNGAKDGFIPDQWVGLQAKRW